MAERNSGWVSGGLVDATDARLATGVLVAPGDGTPIRSRSGVKPAAGAPGLVQATSPTASGSVTVQPFQGVIQAARDVPAGPYLITVDEITTINVLAVKAHPANSRQDLIVAVQTDTEYGGSSTAMKVRHVPGTPSTSPVDPVITDDYLPLARVTVGPSVTTITAANIADLRTFTTATGGVLPVANRSARPASPYPGEAVYLQAEGLAEIFDGSWRPIARGGLTTYGPGDDGWPHTGGTSGSDEFVINRLTIPAVPYARMLFVTTQAVLTATNHVGAYDLNLRADAGVVARLEPRGAQAVPVALPITWTRTRAQMVVQPLPNDAFQGTHLSAVIEQAANRTRVLELAIIRSRGSGVMNSPLGPPYTQLNALAFPV